MKNQKGFALLEGLLILVIVGILAGTGWYVINSKRKTDESLSNSSIASASSPSTGSANEKLKPYKDALLKAGIKPTQAIFQLDSSSIIVTSSKTHGYMLASVAAKNQPGSRYFYSKDDGKSWIYFASTSQIFSCGMFKTVEQREAYKGEPCVDTSKDGAPESTVE